MNHSSSSDYLDAIVDAGFMPVQSGEVPTDLAWVFKSRADGYREESDGAVTIVYEKDTMVEVRLLTRAGLILARPDSTRPDADCAGWRPRWRCNVIVPRLHGLHMVRSWLATQSGEGKPPSALVFIRRLRSPHGGDGGEDRRDRHVGVRHHRHVRGVHLGDRGARPLSHPALRCGRDDPVLGTDHRPARERLPGRGARRDGVGGQGERALARRDQPPVGLGEIWCEGGWTASGLR